MFSTLPTRVQTSAGVAGAWHTHRVSRRTQPPAPGRSAVLRFRWYANFVSLSTPLGLLVALLGRARLRAGPDGLVLAEGYRWGFPVAGAFTIGNVVITARDFPRLLQHHPDLLRHEGRHAWQWLACLGLPFLPLYFLAMAWSWARTGDRATGNLFERAAGLASGGYEVGSKPRRRADRAR